MVGAILQEWSMFSSAWFGDGAPPRGPAAVRPEQREAEQAVRRFLSVMRHLYATGGDARFAERLPAAPAVVDEVMGEIAFLRHQRRREEPELVSLEVLEANVNGPDRVQLRTKEYWVIRSYPLDQAEPVGTPHSGIVFATYLVRLDGPAWRVEGWEVDLPPAPPEPEADAGAAKAGG